MGDRLASSRVAILLSFHLQKVLLNGVCPGRQEVSGLTLKEFLETVMIKFFMSQPALMQLFMLLVHALLVLAVSIGCMRWLGSRLNGRTELLPVAPFFVSVTTVFALFLAFHASTIWSRQHAAEDAFQEAVTAISRLDSLFGKDGVGLDKARIHLSRYAEAVAREEWATGNTQPSAQADQALEALRQELVRASEKMPTAVGNHLWRVFDDVVKARSARLWIGKQDRSEQSWLIVLVLGFLSHIAIGFVHADRPSAGKLAMVLFASATTASYWLLSRAIDPFARLDSTYYLQAISGSGG